MRLRYRFGDYKAQYKQTLALAAPVVLSQVGQVTVQLIDNAMVGRLGALPLAAVSFGGTVFFMVFILAMGLTMGLTPLVGEAFSQRKHREAASYLQNSMLLYGVVGVLALLLLRSGIPLMYHFGQPSEVVDMAIPYFNYLAWSIVPFMIFASFKQFLEGIGNTKVNMVIIITSNLVNILFNYLLIYGNWGFPEMGAAGAGLATMISRICAPVMVIAYFYYKKNFRRYFSFFSWANFRAKWVKPLFGVGAPIALQMFMEGSAFALTSLMMGWIGMVEIAANQIALAISNFAFMIVVGISAATTIRVSHAYGRGNLRELKKATNASFHISLAWNTITALMFVTLRHYIPLIFISDPEVVELASYLLLFVAAFQFSDGLQSIAIGALRGIQDVNMVMLIAFISYIVINLPLGYFCAFGLGIGAGGLWIGFNVGLTVAAVLLISRFWRKYKMLRLYSMRS